MFVGRKELLTLNCLMVFTRLSPVMSVRQTSAMFKMAQHASTSPSYGNRIRCAYSAMHHPYAAIRIAEGDGVCEGLTDAEMALAMEPSFEYYRKYSATQQFQPNIVACVESGEHITIYPYTTVKVGDIYEFVAQRCGTDSFAMTFETIYGSITFRLVFGSSDDGLNTWTSIWGEDDKCSSPDPFASYKGYRMRFELFEAYLEICIDQTVCCQYNHIVPPSAVRRIVVPFDPLVTLKIVKITTADP